MILAIMNISLVFIGSLIVVIWVILKLSNKPVMTMILFLMSLLVGFLLIYPELNKII